MNVKWLIEIGCFPSEDSTILKALKNNNIEHRTVKFGEIVISDEWQTFFKETDCVVFTGSLLSAKRVQKCSGWIPGVYCNLPSYKCSTYYARFGKYIFNDEYIMLPFGDLLRQKEFLYEHLGENRSIFIRPDRGDKIFTGKLVYKEHYEEDIESFNPNKIDKNELIVVARPRNIKAEWRFVVIDDNVITGSQYRFNGIVGYDNYCPIEAINFTRMIAAQSAMFDRVYVIDVCKTMNDDYKIMEIGSFSCAGLYKCNRDIIVKEVSKIALEEYKEFDS